MHPFHPLNGQKLPWLKRRVHHGVPFVQLQVGDDSVSLPEAWTDLAPMAAAEGGAAAPILSRDALCELARLVATLTAEKTGR
jgi:hypothetical protein